MVVHQFKNVLESQNWEAGGWEVGCSCRGKRSVGELRSQRRKGILCWVGQQGNERKRNNTKHDIQLHENAIKKPLTIHMCSRKAEIEKQRSNEEKEKGKGISSSSRMGRSVKRSKRRGSVRRRQSGFQKGTKRKMVRGGAEKKSSPDSSGCWGSGGGNGRSKGATWKL